MWVFTPLGFLSATLTNPSYKELPKEQQHGHIMVRARVKGDLHRLVRLHQEHNLGKRPAILALPKHDYPYRVVVPHREWTLLVTLLADMIDYSNFKNAVEAQAETQLEGQARHDLYLRVWSVMNRAEEWLKDRVEWLTRAPKGRQGSFDWLMDPRQDWELFGAELPYEGHLHDTPDPLLDPVVPGPRGTPVFTAAPQRGKGKKGKKKGRK